MRRHRVLRDKWVSYLRVSTIEQAERELSLLAQQRGADEYAARNGETISRHYIEAGASGLKANRKVFREMLADVFRPGSDIGTIVVYHTSRFTRNATEARVVKEKLRKMGVRVVSVCQETKDDPMGQLIQGIYECMDQYESEMNGLRVSAASREAILRGYFPGTRPPYGFRRVKVEVNPGNSRGVLVQDEYEAEMVKLIFQLYIANSGAKVVARTLNQRGLPFRDGAPWSRDRVLGVLQDPAVRGTYYWGKVTGRECKQNDPSEWLSLPVKRIIDDALFEAADRLRKDRDVAHAVGRQSAANNLLAKIIRCGKCGTNYQLETSGKRRLGALYTYRYYNSRAACRVGKEACSGQRIPCSQLDQAALEFIADTVCSLQRCSALLKITSNVAHEERRARKMEQVKGDLDEVQDRIHRWSEVIERDERYREMGAPTLQKLRGEVQHLLSLLESSAPAPHSDALPDAQVLQEAWRALITSGGSVSRNYVSHLIERIDVYENEISIVPREAFRA